MPEMSLESAVAVLTSEVQGLRRDLQDSRAEIRADMKSMAASYVPRFEWEQWRQSAERDVAEAKSDAETARTEAKAIAETARVELRGEVTKIRGETEARRVPWTAVGAFVVGAASLALTLIQATGG